MFSFQLYSETNETPPLFELIFAIELVSFNTQAKYCPDILNISPTLSCYSHVFPLIFFQVTSPPFHSFYHGLKYPLRPYVFSSEC
jgi:hypothetical protein